MEDNNYTDVETDCVKVSFEDDRDISERNARLYSKLKVPEKEDKFDSAYHSGGDSLLSEVNEGRYKSDEEGLGPIGRVEKSLGSLTLESEFEKKDSQEINYSVDEGYKSESLRSGLPPCDSESSEREHCESSSQPNECINSPCYEEYFHQDEDGDTQLHTSIIQFLEQYALYFISVVKDYQFLNIRNHHLQTPLHLAVITKQPVLARKLITSGAEVDVRDRKGNSPLHIAAKEGYEYICRILLEPVQYDETKDNAYEIPYQPIPQNLEGKNYDGQVCLHLAAEGQHADVMEVLLEKGANINAKDGKSGRTVLHYAAEAGEMNLVSFLLQYIHRGLDINAPTYGGLTPIMLAKGRGHEDVVQFLRNHGAIYESDESEEEDMNEESYDDFMIAGRPVGNHS